LIPRAASSCVSLRKVNGPERIRLRSQSALLRLLVAADLAGRTAPGIPPQILPLCHTGGTDLKRFRYRTDGLACVSPRQSAFANIFRMGSRHPCWTPCPSMEFESEIRPLGIPIPVKNNML
jgi:hypothetical protein